MGAGRPHGEDLGGFGNARASDYLLAAASDAREGDANVVEIADRWSTDRATEASERVGPAFAKATAGPPKRFARRWRVRGAKPLG